MEGFHYEILLLKYANYVARELQERARRFQLEFDGILPPPEMIISKIDMKLDTYIYQHGDQNLLPTLTTTLVVGKPPSLLEKAIRELAGTTSHLTDYLIPLEVTGEVDYFDTYLVKEECLVRVKKMENSMDYIEIRKDLKYKDLIEAVVQMIGCYYSMNEILRVNEGRLRFERFIDALKKERKIKASENEEEEEEEEVNTAYDLARRFSGFAKRDQPNPDTSKRDNNDKEVEADAEDKAD